MPKKAKKQKPSRARYEKAHPVFSARVDKETYDRLTNHLEGTGCSFADFLKDSLGREESMVERRVEMLAGRELDPSLEKRVEALEELMMCAVIHMWDDRAPFWCPFCDGTLHGAMVAEKGSRNRDVFTYACPRCGFMMNPREKLDPRTLTWIDSKGRFISKPLYT